MTVITGLTVLICSGCQATQHISQHLKTTNKPTTTAQSNQPTGQSTDQSILSQLITYTNESSPGPTKNYYWDNGESKVAVLPKDTISFTQDDQNRPSVAKAALSYQQFEASKGSRQGTPLKPVGWPNHNIKSAITYQLTNRTYHGYFYNRSHSIADSLLGEASYSSANNFTTGSRPQNVGADQNGGMRHSEELVENYWRQNPNSQALVYYQVTPVYNGSEVIPRGSIVDVHSTDNVLNTEVVVINSAEGFTINYQNGSVTPK